MRGRKKMASYAEFRKFFETNDGEGLTEAIHETDPLLALLAASRYSAKHLISDEIAWVMIRESALATNMRYAVLVLDELINDREDDAELDVPSSVESMVTMEVTGAGSEGELEFNRNQLAEYVMTCSGEEYDELLTLLARTSLCISDRIILAAIERGRKRLNDDRLFFILMYGTLTEGVMEEAAVMFELMWDALVGFLEEQGYELELVPSDSGSALVIHCPEEGASAAGSPWLGAAISGGPWPEATSQGGSWSAATGSSWPDATSQGSSWSGPTDSWTTRHPRRDFGRRRRR